MERDFLELLLGFSNGTRWGSWDFLLHADLVLSLGQPGEKTRHRLISKQELMLSRRIRLFNLKQSISTNLKSF
jgi:hypothetical protein